MPRPAEDWGIMQIDRSGWKAVVVRDEGGGSDRRGTVRRLRRSEKQERQLFSCVAILTVTNTTVRMFTYSFITLSIFTTSKGYI